jgi:hypothetical protein
MPSRATCVEGLIHRLGRIYQRGAQESELTGNAATWDGPESGREKGLGGLKILAARGFKYMRV